MELKNFFVQDDQGNKLPGATCYVYERGTESLITTLFSATGTVLSNPFISDENGLVQFAANNGLYDVRVITDKRDYRIHLQFNDVNEDLAAAKSYADRAEIARDATLLSKANASSIANGLDKTISGEYFTVAIAGTNDALIFYENNNGNAVEISRYPSSSAVQATDEYVRSLLHLDAADGMIVAMTDSAGNRTWLEANDVDGGPTDLSLQHLERTTGVSLRDDVDGLIVTIADSAGNRTWLEANDVDGGPSDLSLQHLERTTGVSLRNDVDGYLAAVADTNDRLTDLCVRDTDGQVPDWVMERWASRLSAIGVGGDTYPRTAHNSISELRKTRMKLAQLRAGDANTQLHIGWIGDSYTTGHFYLGELTKSLASDYGFAGPGYIGFNVGPALDDTNFLFNRETAAYFGGSWQWSAAGAASPDNRTITAGAAGDYLSIQAVESANISTLITSAKLLFLGAGTDCVVRYRWSDADAWNSLTLSGTGVKGINFTVLPPGINWKFRLEVVSGLPTLFGIFMNNASNGIACSRMASGGTASGDWYKPNDAVWMAQWKAAMALIPCDCYMVMLGGNDQDQNVNPAAFLANLQGLYATLKEINPSADIHFTIRQDTTRVKDYQMSDYAAAVRPWAWANKIPCSDLQYAFGTDPAVYASTGVLPLITNDLAHPYVTTGGRLITEFFYRLLHAAQ